MLKETLVDSIWILGLACLLATFSYMSWLRSVRNWRWGYAVSLPRLLVPFCLSVELLCIGLAINGLTSYWPAPWWETAAWTVLAILFAIQTAVYGIAGIRYGWDTPVEGRRNDRV